MIKLENIYLSFGKKEVLKNVNFEVPEGKIKALMGLSGVGKRNFLNISLAPRTFDKEINSRFLFILSLLISCFNPDIVF